jgi:hypothetical protein
MNDLNQLTTPVLQDWWEHYTCPACMSRQRESWGRCDDRWHSVPAVTYECDASSFSPLSIPVAELKRLQLTGTSLVAKYGRLWKPAARVAKRPLALVYP